MWALQLFQYYCDHPRKFYLRYPTIKRNFFNSVFACCTFNLGPFTVCFDYTNSGNLPFGWCAITALGNFNFKRGGCYDFPYFVLLVNTPTYFSYLSGSLLSQRTLNFMSKICRMTDEAFPSHVLVHYPLLLRFMLS